MIIDNFDKMLSTESDFLKPYARTLTRNEEDAKDLFQETMIKALVNREKYTLGTHPKAWLYTIMRNTFINNYRHNKRFTKVASALSDDSLFFNAGKNSVNSGLSTASLKELLLQVDKLPGSVGAALQLHCLGCSYMLIAGILGQPLGTIKSKIHMARKILISRIVQ